MRRFVKEGPWRWCVLGRVEAEPDIGLRGRHLFVRVACVVNHQKLAATTQQRRKLRQRDARQRRRPDTR